MILFMIIIDDSTIAKVYAYNIFRERWWKLVGIHDIFTHIFSREIEVSVSSAHHSCTQKTTHSEESVQGKKTSLATIGQWKIGKMDLPTDSYSLHNPLSMPLNRCSENKKRNYFWKGEIMALN